MNQKSYEHLHHLSKNIKNLRGIYSLLEWDQETVMPPNGATIRSEHLKVMAGLIHKAQTSKTFSKALHSLIDLDTGVLKSKDLTAPQQTALRVWRREHRLHTAVSHSFVEKFAQLTSKAMHQWKAAREANRFQDFAPYLEKILTMCRQKADKIGYKDHPYDALLEEYEPGMTTNDLKKIFQEVRSSTVNLLKEIQGYPPIDDSFLYGSFSREHQLAFAQTILKKMGHSLDKGRLDESVHPFSSACHPEDSRITTHVHSSAIMSNIRSVLHEAGHSLYEMGLPVEHYGSPLAEAASFGVHESQSRWWETHIGHSKGYWRHHFPLLKEQFPHQFEHVNLDDFYRAINAVSPSLIRIEADEVTYNLHVILRFEIEIALLEGSLSVKDVPEVWNSKMVELLGITPPNDKAGCLQDIHWAMGSFGYFPSYALGNLFSAHLFEAFSHQHPDWETRIASGDLQFITEWLHDHVHKYGQQYNGLELMQQATGKAFSAGSFNRHLRKRYIDVYAADTTPKNRSVLKKG